MDFIKKGAANTPHRTCNWPGRPRKWWAATEDKLLIHIHVFWTQIFKLITNCNNIEWHKKIHDDQSLVNGNRLRTTQDLKQLICVSGEVWKDGQKEP